MRKAPKLCWIFLLSPRLSGLRLVYSYSISNTIFFSSSSTASLYSSRPFLSNQSVPSFTLRVETMREKKEKLRLSSVQKFCTRNLASKYYFSLCRAILPKNIIFSRFLQVTSREQSTNIKLLSPISILRDDSHYPEFPLPPFIPLLCCCATAHCSLH